MHFSTADLSSSTSQSNGWCAMQIFKSAALMLSKLSMICLRPITIFRFSVLPIPVDRHAELRHEIPIDNVPVEIIYARPSGFFQTNWPPNISPKRSSKYLIRFRLSTSIFCKKLSISTSEIKVLLRPASIYGTTSCLLISWFPGTIKILVSSSCSASINGCKNTSSAISSSSSALSPELIKAIPHRKDAE